MKKILNFWRVKRMIKLNKKKNGSGKVTSYTINISKKEALQLGWIDEEGEPLHYLNKEIVNNKLITNIKGIKPCMNTICKKIY